MTQAEIDLRQTVHELAEQAFHQGLISGFGDGEFEAEYQIVLEGKPRHFSLEYARSFLSDLLEQAESSIVHPPKLHTS
ncbi:MAG TPA: hypothetical protein V6D18_11605 [Thermosynechococcaceae cyanobacterium]